MANFFNPWKTSEDYDVVDLVMKPGETRSIALYGGGPAGEDLALLASKEKFITWSKPKTYARIPNTRIFGLTARQRGFVRLYGMHQGARWATMEIYIAPRDIVKSPPPKVPQVLSWLCWAAAMSSFLTAMGDPKSRDELKKTYATDEETGAQQPNEQRAIEYFKKKHGQLYEMDKDRAKTHNMGFMLKDLGLEYQVKAGSSLTFDYFYKMLTTKGRLWICIDKGRDMYSHCLVMYGAIEAGETPSYDRFLVMDPNSSQGSYEIWTMETLKALPQVVVAWNP